MVNFNFTILVSHFGQCIKASMVIVILPQKIGLSITACAPDQIQDTERMPVPIGVSFWGGPLLGVQKVKVFTAPKMPAVTLLPKLTQL